jgi:hypothetical protein
MGHRILHKLYIVYAAAFSSSYNITGQLLVFLIPDDLVISCYGFNVLLQFGLVQGYIIMHHNSHIKHHSKARQYWVLIYA